MIKIRNAHTKSLMRLFGAVGYKHSNADVAPVE